jgi:hypothetical protein
MFETYRMLGREREQELESEAVRLRPLAARPINRISVVIVAVVVVAAVAFGATAARADVWLDNHSRAELKAGASSADLIERWVARQQTPEDRITARSTEGSGLSSNRFAGTVSPAPVARPGEGFDWRAAGVGASTVAALVLALGFGIGLARRFRFRSVAA